MDQYELLGYSKNGKQVVFDPIHSHAITHFRDTPGLRELVEQVLPAQVLEGEELLYDIDMGKVIGLTDGVETSSQDTIVYAKRLNREGYSRFTKSQVSQPSSLLALAFKRIDNTTYELASAWVGGVAPPFPGGKDETPESRPYWSSHALVWGNQETQPGTETSRYPW